MRLDLVSSLLPHCHRDGSCTDMGKILAVHDFNIEQLCVCVCLNNTSDKYFLSALLHLACDGRERGWFSANRAVNKTTGKLWCLRLAAMVGGEEDGKRRPWL